MRLFKEHGRSAFSGRELQRDQFVHLWLIHPAPCENQPVWHIDLVIDSLTGKFGAIRIDEGYGK